MKKRIIHLLYIIKNRLCACIKINLAFRQAGNSKKRILFIGSPEHPNIGDHAISLAEVDFFNKYFTDYKIVEITGNMCRNARKYLTIKARATDIVVITGGGFIGDLWPIEELLVENILIDFSKNKIIIMPQTIYFSNEENSVFLKQLIKNCNDLKIFCRDEFTYKYANNTLNADSYLLPDMVLFFNAKDSLKQRENICVCFRDDKEGVLKDKDKIITLLEKHMNVKYISTLAKHNVSLVEREQVFNDILSEISSSKLLVTDRLHATLFAYITKTPCISFDNISKKVSGVCKWINKCNYIKIAQSSENIDILINDMLSINNKISVNTLNSEFETMAQLIMK